MTKRRQVLAVFITIALLIGGVFAIRQVTRAQDGFTYAGQVAAPEFPSGLDWLNVSDPLTISELQGKIIILDFWTYGCINCIHIIPDLHELEAKYGDKLVVIGVHSAKFENEGQTANIRQIVQRYAVKHPVVNDADFVIWRTYGVRAWPTLVLIDPQGKIVGGHSGEGIFSVFDPILAVMVDEYGEAGLLDDTPLAKLAPETSPPTPLYYPGKVQGDLATSRLLVSDTANHRIVVTPLDGNGAIQVIGTGERGFVDGSFSEAQFNEPQGIAIDGDLVYIADTRNHAIRVIDFSTETVSTLVGTGQQATTYPPRGGTAPDVTLSSPWDITLFNNMLYIAMAGPHQLWRINLLTGQTDAHAGSGREGIIDGPLAAAQLAQPSGIDTDGAILYFADSEVSAIRTADLDPSGHVTTIVGTGLFDFGDVDGIGDEVRLQHALGVVVTPDGMLYVADTYNNKIKLIDPIARESRTFAGTGQAGWVDGALSEAQFYEPGGLDYINGKLYIADTNNHVIRVIDLSTETVSTLVFEDTSLLLPTELPTPPSLTPVTIDNTPFAFEDKVVRLEPQTVAPGKGALVFAITMPDGYKLNDLAPFTITHSGNPALTIADDFITYQEVLPALPLRLPATFTEGSATYRADLTIYWCEGVNQTLCFVESVTLEVPLTVNGQATTSEIILPYDLVPPTGS